MQFSVRQAAEMLDVHPQRVHQRIRDGSLPAHKVGHQWVLEEQDVRRLLGASSPGRPYSARSAWDLLAVAAGSAAAAELSPWARSRARSRLRSLLAEAPLEDLDLAAARVSGALRNRADRSLHVASPRDLPDLLADERLAPSGLSLPRAGIAAAGLAEGYVESGHAAGLVSDYLLSPASGARANVVLHVIPADVHRPAFASPLDVAPTPLALAADLAEHAGPRERDAMIRVLGELRTTLTAAEDTEEGRRGA